jgi:hypothetical protein
MRFAPRSQTEFDLRMQRKIGEISIICVFLLINLPILIVLESEKSEFVLEANIF